MTISYVHFSFEFPPLFGSLIMILSLSFVLSFLLQRCLDQDMPQLDFFSLLRESDAQFLARSGWRYRRDAPVHIADQTVHVTPPGVFIPVKNLGQLVAGVQGMTASVSLIIMSRRIWFGNVITGD